jgi:hypothetical protein
MVCRKQLSDKNNDTYQMHLSNFFAKAISRESFFYSDSSDVDGTLKAQEVKCTS